MGSKTGLEYGVRHVKTSVQNGGHCSWDRATEKIREMCAAMSDDGWTLSTMSWPALSHAVLVFTRPERAD